MSDVLIRCENVSKRFCRDLKKSLWYGVRDLLGDLLPGRENIYPKRSLELELRSGEFWAVRDIHFEVKRGECLALIGRNGAGKTTLLKLLNGLIKPDTGSIELRGRVGGLIALGAGFNPVLSGRENICVNAAILGLSKRQTHDCMEKIIEFAELSGSIDAPLRTYSSGMQVRLGFATAISLSPPDVLLLDEVLAVGDMAFVIKCLNAIRTLTSQSAVVLVTHSMQYVSTFCTSAAVLANGTMLLESSNLAEAIDAYYGSFQSETSISGNGQAKVNSVRLRSVDDFCSSASHFVANGDVELQIELEIETNRPAELRLFVMSQGLVPLIASNVLSPEGAPFILTPGKHHLQANLGSLQLNAGVYPIVVLLRDVETKETLIRAESAASLRVVRDFVDWGFLSRKISAIPIESEFIHTAK